MRCIYQVKKDSSQTGLYIGLYDVWETLFHSNYESLSCVIHITLWTCFILQHHSGTTCFVWGMIKWQSCFIVLSPPYTHSQEYPHTGIHDNGVIIKKRRIAYYKGDHYTFTYKVTSTRLVAASIKRHIWESVMHRDIWLPKSGIVFVMLCEYHMSCLGNKAVKYNLGVNVQI